MVYTDEAVNVKTVVLMEDTVVEWEAELEHMSFKRNIFLLFL